MACIMDALFLNVNRFVNGMAGNSAKRPALGRATMSLGFGTAHLPWRGCAGTGAGVTLSARSPRPAWAKDPQLIAEKTGSHGRGTATPGCALEGESTGRSAGATPAQRWPLPPALAWDRLLRL